MKKFLAIMMALSMMLCAFAVAETASPVASTVASPVASPVADMVGDPADLPVIAAVLNGGSEVYVPSDKTNKTLQDALNHEFTEGAGYDSFAVLDVDGDCGGFNLMFAFGSGILAGLDGRNPPWIHENAQKS